jgi:pimeloyl-ACP methyl ester carboxylesterase
MLRASPAHYIAIDHAARQVILVVRGAASGAESAVMVAAGNQQWRRGTAHVGMLTSAEALWAEVAEPLHRLLEAHPGYSLVSIGHSLGAPAAALVALYARERGLTSNTGTSAATAITFASPAYVSPSAQGCIDEVCDTLVCGEDFVPRIHFLGLERLRARLGRLRQPSEQGFGDALTRFHYIVPGRLFFLRPRRWYEPGFPLKAGRRLVELKASSERTVTYSFGDRFCAASGSTWPHAEIESFPFAADFILGDIVLTDAMILDHLVSSVAAELEHLRGQGLRERSGGLL